MATLKNTSTANVERAVDNELGIAPVADKKAIERVYKVIGTDVKVPVSKKMGVVWKGRIDAAKRARKSFQLAWDEAIKYYNHDQLGHRDAREGSSGNMTLARRRNEAWSETENIVFANVKAVTPAIYAKNPKPEMTAFDSANGGYAKLVEAIVYALSRMDHPPGINMKTLARQCVVHAQLTNCAWIETGWVFKEDSSEVAVQALSQIATQLEKATSVKEIEECEGKLQALESKIDFLTPSGPWARMHPAHRIYVDPAATNSDFSDATWMAIEEYYPTAFLMAQFGQDKDGDNRTKSLYQPSHILLASEGEKEDYDNFKLFNTSDEATKFGYNDEAAFKKAQYTKCWRIWDKTTRRVYLYADAKWEWPIWVWQDKYDLPRFFPLRNLAFHVGASGGYTKGEVTYYLDQQDAINEICDQERRARLQIFNKVFVDTNHLTPDAAEKFLQDPKRQMHGFKVPEGKKMGDVIFTLAPPSLEFPQVFNKQSKLEAADRISGTGVILRNEQFKTNTTNDAIAQYESTTRTRLDEKLDAIEDFLGGVYADIAHLCIRFMPMDMVVQLVGQEFAQNWRNLSAEEAKRFEMTVVGGSTQKPTSQGKKKEAMEIGRVLGQFGASSPTVIEIVLRLFSNAFDEIEMRPEHWDRLRAELAAALGGGGDAPNGAAQPGAAAQPADVIKQAASLIDGMPPAAKKALGTAIVRGVPLVEAVSEIMRTISKPTAPTSGDNGA